jgi:hypothetical protein
MIGFDDLPSADPERFTELAAGPTHPATRRDDQVMRHG